MENVKTFEFDVKLENDTLVVEQGAILGETPVDPLNPNDPNRGNEVGFGGALSVFGTLQGATVKNYGYIGVGVNGAANLVGVEANGTFEVWANAVANNATVRGVAANTGNMIVNAGAKAYNTTVNAFGQLHINGIAHDTFVDGGFAGVGNGAKAYDSVVRAGDMKVFNGGFADDTVVDGGTFEVLAGGFADDTFVTGFTSVVGGQVITVVGEFIVQAGAQAVSTEVNAGQMLIAGGALVQDIEVSGTGDVTFFPSNAYVGSGDLEIGQGGAVNTWGAVGWTGSIALDFDRAASQLDKARIDNLSAFNGAMVNVEIDSDLNAGRYLIAANANNLWQGINFSDGDVEGVCIVGGEGAYLNDKTYAFNIDANGNLYVDVMEGFVAYADYAATNSVGAGRFGLVGEQIVWTNAEKNAVAIAGRGVMAAPGEFAAIGDFDGNGIDDLLFTNGNDAIVLFQTNLDTNADGVFDVATATYKDLLSAGSISDFQVGDWDADGIKEVFLKNEAVGVYVATELISANADPYTAQVVAYTTCVK